MGRLAEFGHNVVGDVDDVIDGAITDGEQTGLEPLGRFFDFDVFHDSGGEARAAF